MARVPCDLSALLLLSSTILLLLAGIPPPTTAKVPVPFVSISAKFYAFNGVPLPEFAKGRVLKKRAPDLTWDAALAKGQTMLNKISGARQNTQWTTVEQLEVRWFLTCS